MTSDTSRTLDRLYPPNDGESPVRHRTGTIAAVNGDGTVDVTLGAVTVPSVSVLGAAAVSEVVQVLVWKGDLLVLGSGGGGGGPLGYIGHDEKTANQGSITTEADVTDLSVTFTALADRRYRVLAFVRLLKDASAGVPLIRITDGSNNSLAAGNTNVAASSRGTMTLLLPSHTPSAGSFTYKVRASAGTGALTVEGSASAPSSILVDDIGAA